MIIEIIVISFIVVWVWIIYQLYTAPLLGDDEMPINVEEKNINEDLFNHNCDKEDVK
tara:strand:+ start:66 stop:236 length:171 start_codon:yes stop_codon:yes gene_type:complete